jgi:hypothetical protein
MLFMTFSDKEDFSLLSSYMDLEERVLCEKKKLSFFIPENCSTKL